MSEAAGSRVVAITGASSGIGRCTARLFAERGWRVGLIARGLPGLETVREEIRAMGGEAHAATADVADHEALDRAAEEIEAALGPIEVWVNNAGAGFYAPFQDITEEEFRRVTDVTYLGVVHGTRAALRRMKPRGRGAIVNIGSLVAFRASPLLSAYSAAKFAVRGFTEAVRAELIHDASPVHITIVHPPAVNTPFFSHAGSRMPGAPRPPPPVYQPEIITDAIYLAATSRRREIKVSGATVQTSLLTRVAPNFTDLIFGKIGYGAQQTREPEVERRRDESLFQPPKQPSPVHGPFGQDAFEHSAQMWLSRNRWTAGLGAALGGLMLLVSQRKRSSRS
jgi:short-subunit dehydrogenase